MDIVDAKKEIDYIMDNFDFEKVQKTMEFLDWTWYESHVPSVAEMKKVAQQLLEEVTENPEYRECSTGGFHAQLTKDERLLRLSFYVEEWDSSCCYEED